MNRIRLIPTMIVFIVIKQNLGFGQLNGLSLKDSVHFISLNSFSNSSSVGRGGCELARKASIDSALKKYSVELDYLPVLRDLNDDSYLLEFRSQIRLRENEMLRIYYRILDWGSLNGILSIHKKDIIVSAEYLRQLSSRLNISCAPKFLRFRFNSLGDESSSSSMAFDIAILYHLFQNSDKVFQSLKMGAEIRNVGSKIILNQMQSYFLPIRSGIGFEALLNYSKFMSASLVSDLYSSQAGNNIAQPEIIGWNSGLELCYLDLISFRFGYYYEQRASKCRSGFNYGVGTKVPICVDRHCV